MWQALHIELEPLGLTVVTVALDTDVDDARPFHEAAAPTHPALVDPALSLVDTFGITNVPFGVWIDETGTIVRPAEVAFAPRDDPAGADDRQARAAEGLPPEHRATMAAMFATIGDRSRYGAAVRDWAARGPASPHVLGEAEVVDRSRPRPREAAEAAAEFELAQHLHRAGHAEAAVAHFRRAHELDPTNWSYVRQAHHLVDPSIPNPYGTDLLTELAAVGPETFYPTLDL